MKKALPWPLSVWSPFAEARRSREEASVRGMEGMDKVFLRKFFLPQVAIKIYTWYIYNTLVCRYIYIFLRRAPLPLHHPTTLSPSSLYQMFLTFL